MSQEESAGSPANPDTFAPDAVAVAMRRGPGRQELVRATPEVVAAICKNVAGGMSCEGAMILSGIARHNQGPWLKRNSAAAELIQRAEAEFERQIVAVLKAKSASDAKVAQWLLERRNGATWGAVNRTQFTGPGGGPVATLTVSKVLFAQMASAPDLARPVAAPKGGRAVKAADVESVAARASTAGDTADDTGADGETVAQVV